jgi:hypothetical protein
LVVIRHTKNEVTFGRAKNFGIILQRLARIGGDDLAMLASEMCEEGTFFGIAGIVANDNLNLRAGPRAGLRDPRESPWAVPVRWKQY